MQRHVIVPVVIPHNTAISAHVEGQEGRQALHLLRAGQPNDILPEVIKHIAAVSDGRRGALPSRLTRSPTVLPSARAKGPSSIRRPYSSCKRYRAMPARRTCSLTAPPSARAKSTSSTSRPTSRTCDVAPCHRAGCDRGQCRRQRERKALQRQQVYLSYGHCGAMPSRRM